MNRTLLIGIDDLGPIPDRGDIVICGPARAVWTVRWTKLLSDDRVAINLEPKDPADVRLDATVQELPMVPMAPLIQS
jgi:hypothetical protein